MTDTPSSGGRPSIPNQFSLGGLIRRPIEYGLIGAAAVLVIALADKLDVLPLKFKGLGTEVEFGTKQKEVLTSNAELIAELEGRVEKLQGQLAEVVDSARRGQKPQTTAAAVKALPEDSGNVSKALLVEDEIVQGGTGVVWIGTFDPQKQTWTDRSVTGTGGTLGDPQSLKANSVIFEIDVNVRATAPARTDTYYEGIARLGVAKRGTPATIIGDPIRYVRSTGIQYWAEIRMDYVKNPAL